MFNRPLVGSARALQLSVVGPRADVRIAKLLVAHGARTDSIDAHGRTVGRLLHLQVMHDTAHCRYDSWHATCMAIPTRGNGSPSRTTTATAVLSLGNS